MSNFITEKLPIISFESSAEWVSAAAEAARKCSPPEGLTGRGVVIIAGGRYLTDAWIAIKAMRHFGATLPVQIWYLGEHEMPPKMAEIFTAIDVELINAHELKKTYPHNRLGGWEAKAYALLHCRWREVIFLDADNIPLQNIEKLFDSKLYKQYGSLFWPDRGKWSAESKVWAMTGIPYRDESEFEAGQMVIDRSRCWRELVMANAFNNESIFWYLHVHGDKDTFRLAWRSLGTEYGMIPHYGDGGWPLFHQKDEDGQFLFHHGIKWDTRPNTEHKLVPEVCNHFLSEFLLASDGAVVGQGLAPPPPKISGPLVIDTGLPRHIAIDQCHIDYIHGVVRALKPTNILEIGLGTGATASALLDAITRNERGHLTVVDNWYDFGWSRPALQSLSQANLDIVTAEESVFIGNAAPVYDLIVMDADLATAHTRWENVVRLLRPGGCAFFHDVTYGDRPHMRHIYEESKTKYAVQLFNTSTTADEACDRGLLTVWRGHDPHPTPPKVAVVQFGTGPAAEFLACAAPLHEHACKKYGYDYIVKRDAETGKHVYWEKQRVLAECAAQGYDFICWLDADALWLGESSLLDVWACAPPVAIFAATFHGDRHDGIGHHYNHVNAGVLFLRNIAGAAISPLSLWERTDDEKHPWGDQHSLNKLLNSQPTLAHIIGHEWNSVEWSREYSSPAPKIVAWHGKPELVMKNMPAHVDAYRKKHGI
jgi:predicted O-methyltransferase YrrM